MARGFKFYTTLGTGEAAQQVGYSYKQRGEFLAVTFTDGEGNRQEKMTDARLRGKEPEPQFHIEAAKAIVRAFAKTLPSVEKAKWDAALEEVIKTTTARSETIRGWRTGVEGVKKFLPEVLHPSDMTPELAQRFGRLFLSTPYTRGKSTVQRKRSPVTLSYYTRALSALWRHFKELGHAKGNPWLEVTIPQPEKKQKYVPTAEDIDLFFAYIYERFPKWERLHALLHVKLITACRTADVVQLKTAQLANGQLVFLASQTKTKADRAVPLPPDLYATLQRIGGKVWLWDGWNEEVIKYRPGANPLPKEFVARTVLVIFNNIFREYSDAHPKRPRLNPHDFRRRSITNMVKATGSIDTTATALGITAACAKAHYLDAQQAFDTQKAFAQALPGLLSSLPKKVSEQSPTIPPLTGNNG